MKKIFSIFLICVLAIGLATSVNGSWEPNDPIINTTENNTIIDNVTVPGTLGILYRVADELASEHPHYPSLGDSFSTINSFNYIVVQKIKNYLPEANIDGVIYFESGGISYIGSINNISTIQPFIYYLNRPTSVSSNFKIVYRISVQYVGSTSESYEFDPHVAITADNPHDAVTVWIPYIPGDGISISR
ncbi:MAG: hypothetical protein LBT66_06220 [Methanobrevibacter sp.]|jgi:hypothetical protein|nr:hypothetical protein [Candidatus Methanovirga meridionalis]